MIKYYQRTELDIYKYDHCVVEAFNTRIYAQSWYLDAVCEHWSCLVLNDYEAVMPLPWKRKFLIPYIYPPTWIQQLGIFPDIEGTLDLSNLFLQEIPKYFKKITIQFNSDNYVEGDNVINRTNAILKLNTNFELLFKGFNSNRKRDYFKALKLNPTIDKELKPEVFIEFYKNTSKSFKLLPIQLKALENLLALNNDKVHIWGVRMNNGLEASCCWLKDDKRITLLIPCATKSAKKNGLSTFIIGELIKQFASSDLTLDFEGSSIPDVLYYYQSFGAEVEEYQLFKKSFYLI